MECGWGTVLYREVEEDEDYSWRRGKLWEVDEDRKMYLIIARRL